MRSCNSNFIKTAGQARSEAMFKTLRKTQGTIGQNSSGISCSCPANLAYSNMGYGEKSYEQKLQLDKSSLLHLFPKAAIRLKTTKTGSFFNFLSYATEVSKRSRQSIELQSQSGIVAKQTKPQNGTSSSSWREKLLPD